MGAPKAGILEMSTFPTASGRIPRLLPLAIACLLPAAAAARAATTSAHSAAAAAEKLAERVESELRYPEAPDAGLDARALACFASGRDLARLRSVAGLEDELRAAFFRRGVRLLLVEDEVVPQPAVATRGGRRPARASLAFLGDEGEGEIRVQGEEPTFAPISAAYESKPWVADLAPYRTEGAKRGAVVVRGESGLEGSEEDAVAAAVGGATEALRAEAIRLASESNSSRVRDAASGRPAVSNRLAAFLDAGIIERHFLADRYVEEIEKPYGNVYKAAVLVRADAGSLTRAVCAASDDVERERENLLVKAGILAAAAPVLLGLYLWLDAATRGYFSAGLKVAFVLAFGGVSWVVLQMSL